MITWTKRVAAESIAAIPGEAIPFFGITLLVAGTGYELYEACNSIKDLDRLYSDMGMEDETPDDVMHSVCHPTMPDAGEVCDVKLKGMLGNTLPVYRRHLSHYFFAPPWAPYFFPQFSIWLAGNFEMASYSAGMVKLPPSAHTTSYWPRSGNLWSVSLKV